MFSVKLHDLEAVEDKELTRVVCVCQYQGKWVYSKHKERETWEIPGGHIENGETWQEAARRELYEETGATKVELTPICLYSIYTYANLCYAKILEIKDLPDSEIETIGFFDNEPDNLTYPESHHLFFETVKEKIKKDL